MDSHMTAPAPLWSLIYRPGGGLSSARPIAAIRADLLPRIGPLADSAAPPAPAPQPLAALLDAPYPVEINPYEHHYAAGGAVALTRSDGQRARIAETLIRLIEIGPAYQTTAADGPIVVLDRAGAPAAILAVYRLK